MNMDYKEHSKKNWAPATNDSGFPGREAMQLGCLQRIADATELMAKNFLQLQAEAEQYKRYYEQEKKYKDTYRKSMIAYKAHNTRLKNKINNECFQQVGIKQSPPQLNIRS
jgi:hypothetical protein